MRPRTLSPHVLCLALTALAGSCGVAQPAPETIAGSCAYTNRFSSAPECRDYLGGWTAAQIKEDCDAWQGAVTLGRACQVDALFGSCALEKDGLPLRANLPGSDPAGCAAARRGCEVFGGGVFAASTICRDGAPDTGGGQTGLPLFQQPQRRCQAPRNGEAPGQSPGGQVCTWEMISGATEEGRTFTEYASCDRVRTQRPYYPMPTAQNATREDPRMQDAAYTTELAWVRGQIEATACVCCHASKAPRGPSNWYVDQPGNFINGFFDRGVAMGAGWIDTSSFGAYAKEENNGFSRATPEDPFHTIFVTTDDARMRRFFLAEATRRGLKKEQFAGQYAAGPLDEQLRFRPSACAQGEGVDTDGRLLWRGGAARYVYVLEESATSPTVPPNLDLPRGTLWRVDVSADGAPVASGALRYGQVPAGMTQRAPSAGAPPALEKGKRYYLYVTADIIQPITRCVFTAP